MSLLLALGANGAARISGAASARPAPSPASPANAGHGDVRKKIVPVVKQSAGPSASAWEGGAYHSAAEWLETPRQGGAILLQPADDPRMLAGTLDGAALIAVDFHRIGDGRGYSQAFLLRHRLGYAGPLRAIGAVTADQVFALKRVGFTSFALRDDQLSARAEAALHAFTMPYQGAPVAGSDEERAEANFTARVRRLERCLEAIAARYKRPALATSLSAEDMVITDAIARLGLPIDIFMLDTGRLHQETLALVAEVKARYDIAVAVYRPDQGDVNDYVAAHGRDGFYEGAAPRRLCCHIRKVAPLARALAGREAWITGQRREQALSRAALQEREHDAAHSMTKHNPLADWAWADVLAYASAFGAPLNALYARGFVSIGCEPCTKAIRPGEDPRKGRWWWEAEEGKECGLHANPMTARR